MKYLKYLGLSLLLFSSFLGMGQTDVSGTISSNTTWGLSGGPYTVTGNILVSSGVTLTIEAGVTVKVNSGFYIKNEGILSAVGTSFKKIIFESSASSPSKSDWEGIRIRPTGGSSIDGSQNYSSGSQFKYVIIKHADIGLYVYDAGFHISYSEFISNNGSYFSDSVYRVNGESDFYMISTLLDNSIISIDLYDELDNNITSFGFVSSENCYETLIII